MRRCARSCATSTTCRSPSSVTSSSSSCTIERAPMAGHRTDRVGALLQSALSELLLRDVKDPRIGMATVTGVKLSPDLKHATVYVSTLGDAAAQARMLQGLASA